MRPRQPLIVLVVLGALLPARAAAYIERLYTLGEILEESTNVLIGRIESVDARKLSVVARIEGALKGAKDYELVQMNLGAGPRGQSAFLVELLERDDPFVLYYARSGGSIQSLAHSGDHWFQLFADHENDDRQVWWRFTHLEIYLPRTFAGRTPELINATRDVLAGKGPGPRPNPDEPVIDVNRLDGRRARQRKHAGGGGSSAQPGGARDDAPVTLIAAGAPWKFIKGQSEPSGGDRDAWRGMRYDDAAWGTGRAPFGYGDPPFGTTLDDMQSAGGSPGYTTLYLRHRFVVPAGASVRDATCRVDYDDGFILWLNGRQVVAANAPAGSPAHDAVAAGNHESGSFETLAPSGGGAEFLPGENIAAVQVFNRELTSSDLKFDMELEVVLENRAAPRVRTATGRFDPIVELDAPAGGEVRGISWADVNGDELLDVYFCRSGGDRLLVNDAGGFSDATRSFGLAGASRSAAWADWDGDDHPDLVTSDFRLYAHAAGRLTDRSPLLAPPATRNPEGAGWIDYNGDGRPDVLITNGEHGILLWENTGEERRPFRDVSRKAGLGPGGIGAGNGDFVACADFDGDGYTDFFYNLGAGLLAHNEGDGTFSVERSCGIELPGGAAAKRGLAIADFDQDGDLDLFVPAAERPALYRNENDGSFRNVIERAGELGGAPPGSFAAAWGDVDHDGHLDLFVGYEAGPARLYLGDGAGGFRDATRELGLAAVANAAAGSFADVDGDGDLDLAVNRDAKVAVYRNDLAKKAGMSAVTVRVAVRRGQIGSTVRVLAEDGRLLGLRQPSAAEGCGGQKAPVSHVAVPEGTCRIAVALGDGRFAEKTADARGVRTEVTFRESDFRR